MTAFLPAAEAVDIPLQSNNSGANDLFEILRAAQAVGAPVQFIHAGVYMAGGTYNASGTRNNTQSSNSSSSSNSSGGGNGNAAAQQSQEEFMRSMLEEYDQRNQARYNNVVGEIGALSESIRQLINAPQGGTYSGSVEDSNSG